MKVKEMFEELQKLMEEKPEVAELNMYVTDEDGSSKQMSAPVISIGCFMEESRPEEGSYSTIEFVEEWNAEFPEDPMNATINACSIDF